MNLSLRARIFLGTFLLTVVTIAGVGIPLLVFVRDHALDEVESSLEKDAFQTASLVVTEVEKNNAPAVSKTADDVARQIDARVVVTDKSGQLIHDSESPERSVEDFTNRPEIQTALSGLTASDVRHSDTLNTDLLVVAVPIAHGGRVVGAVRVSRDISKVRAEQLRVSLGVGALLLLLAAAGGLVSSVVSRSVTRPVQAISDVAGRIGHGELDARATESGPPEIRSLAHSLNDLAARVESAIATERSFVGNAAHQLRTPLTAMSIRLDTLAGIDDLNEADAANLTEIRDEIQGLSHLIDQLLVLSRTSEPGAVLLERPVDVTRVLKTVGATWRDRLANAGIDLEVSIADDLPPLSLPPELLAQACENLLDNIALYCPEGDEATFSARDDGGFLEIVVSDSGPGMDPRALDGAFSRFARGQSTQRGSGLGLAVVKQVVDAAGGTVEIETSTSGTTVRMRIPAAG